MGRQMVPDNHKDTRTPMVKIPFFDRLLRSKGERESQHVIAITIASVTEIPIAQVLLEDYRKAVADGRLDEAKTLAIRAIEADPKCFAK